MGAFYSKSGQPQIQELPMGKNNANSRLNASGIDYGSIHSNDRGGSNKYDDVKVSNAAESLQLLSQQEMEHEFEKIYQRSHHLLQSLTHNPCEELTDRIAQCLEENAKQMSNCFNEMSAYQACVAQQSSDKLVRH